MSVNGTLVEDKMRSFKGECAHFSFNKCFIYTHNGASAKFSTNTQETDNSAILHLSWVLRVKSMCHVPHLLEKTYTVEVLSSQIDIWLASFLVDCPPATQAAGVLFLAETYLSQGALLVDGENIAQVSYNIYAQCIN
ncbi:MAG: hypothetical protein ACK53Y_01615, partial [bacterium]